MIGINLRSTLDIDATVKGIPISQEKIIVIIKEIIALKLDDNVSFEIINVKNIHSSGKYEDFRITIEAKFFNLKEYLKIDLTTGDMIIPREIKYKYMLMFEDRTIKIMAYHHIKAYDECSPQKNELRYLIENLSEWLYEESKEDYIFLNLAQVKYRLGTLKVYDIDRIIDIGDSNKDNIEIQAGVSILLKKKEDAETLIADMNPEQKELFMSYPICHLLKNNDELKSDTNKD